MACKGSAAYLKVGYTCNFQTLSIHSLIGQRFQLIRPYGRDRRYISLKKKFGKESCLGQGLSERLGTENESPTSSFYRWETREDQLICGETQSRWPKRCIRKHIIRALAFPFGCRKSEYKKLSEGAVGSWLHPERLFYLSGISSQDPNKYVKDLTNSCMHTTARCMHTQLGTSEDKTQYQAHYFITP